MNREKNETKGAEGSKRWPKSKSFDIRAEVYNRCLLQTDITWTKEALVKEVNEVLRKRGVECIKERTFYDDRKQMLRVYGAAGRIERYGKEFYRYAPGAGLPNVALSNEELDALWQVYPVVKRLDSLKLGPEVRELLRKIEASMQLGSEHSADWIEFDTGQQTVIAEGVLADFYNAIRCKHALDVEYEPYDAERTSYTEFSPHRLKEVRHRWFVVGSHRRRLLVLGLERVKSTLPSLGPFDARKLDIDGYFRHLVGITLPYDGETEPSTVRLEVRGSSVPYMRSKRIHPSARIVDDWQTGLIVELTVQLNYELDMLILSYAENIRVLSPERLRQRIRQRLQDVQHWYEND